METQTERHMEAITLSPRLLGSKWGCITLARSFTTELFPCCFYSDSLITPDASGSLLKHRRGGHPLAKSAVLFHLGFIIECVFALYPCVDLK